LESAQANPVANISRSLFFRLGGLDNLIQNAKHLIQNTKHLIQNTKHLIQNTKNLIQNTKHLIQNTKHFIQNTKHLIFLYGITNPIFLSKVAQFT
jgi:hypothetical protein